MSSNPPLPFRPASHYAGAYGTQTKLWLANRFGQRLKQIPLREVAGGTITHSDSGDAARTMTISVEDPSLVRPFYDFLIPEFTLTRSDGSKQTGSFGLFMATPPATRFGETHRYTGDIEGKDITYLLSRSAMPPSKYAAGRDVGDICREIIMGAGFIASQIDIPNTGYLLAAEFKVDPNERRLSVVNRLLKLANWYPVWMSNANRIKSRKEIILQDMAARKTYSNKTVIVEILPDVVGTTDWSGMRNVVTAHVAGDGDTKPDLWSLKRITNQLHDLYYDPNNPGSHFPIELDGPSPDVTGIETQAALDQLVLAELNKKASMIDKRTIRTIIDLEADAYDVLNMDIWKGSKPIMVGKYIRNGWSITIDGVVATIDSQVSRIEVIQ